LIATGSDTFKNLPFSNILATHKFSKNFQTKIDPKIVYTEITKDLAFRNMDKSVNLAMKSEPRT
jgi:hypothetical protein